MNFVRRPLSFTKRTKHTYFVWFCVDQLRQAGRQGQASDGQTAIAGRGGDLANTPSRHGDSCNVLMGSLSKWDSHSGRAKSLPLPRSYLLLLTRAAKTTEEDDLHAQETRYQRPRSRGKLLGASTPGSPRERSGPGGPEWRWWRGKLRIKDIKCMFLPSFICKHHKPSGTVLGVARQGQ